MMDKRYIEAQALDFANIPLLDRRYKASVHLENIEDELFWNTLLQQVCPGEYNFIPASRSAKGNQTSGCEQCLKYVGYLSKYFFVCIDSDLRNVIGRNAYSAKDFVAQTYTYSWENHLCHSPELQQRFKEKCKTPKRPFDFDIFLTKYSEVLYHALLLLIHEERAGNKDFFKNLLSVLPKQCITSYLENNGERYCTDLELELLKLEDVLGNPDFSEAKAICVEVGITSQNAYLYMRGHNVYDLVVSIGRAICKVRGVSFTNDILNANFSTSSYPEIKLVLKDLAEILY